MNLHFLFTDAKNENKLKKNLSTIHLDAVIPVIWSFSNNLWSRGVKSQNLIRLEPVSLWLTNE